MIVDVVRTIREGVGSQGRTRAMEARSASRAPRGKSAAPPIAVAASSASAASSMATTRRAVARGSAAKASKPWLAGAKAVAGGSAYG